jgi:hypothetical protein
LKLLYHLRVDTLTILGAYRPSDAYHTLSNFIAHGNGWKELRFVAPASTMLGYPLGTDHDFRKYQREPQPSTWEAQLLARDGQGSGASVTIYRSTVANKPGSVLDPRTRERFEQAPWDKELEDSYGHWEEQDLTRGTGAEKELLVVLKRGHDADIFERTRPPIDKSDDIRKWAGSMSWEDIKDAAIFDDSDITCCGDSDFEDEETVDTSMHIDTYRDVDDVEWWPNPFWRVNERGFEKPDRTMRDYRGDRRNVP